MGFFTLCCRSLCFALLALVPAAAVGLVAAAAAGVAIDVAAVVGAVDALPFPVEVDDNDFAVTVQLKTVIKWDVSGRCGEMYMHSSSPCPVTPGITIV